MTTDSEQWVVHVQSTGKDFIKSALVVNKKTTISSSFESDIVLRKLQTGETKIQLSWVQAPSVHRDAEQTDAEQPQRVPCVQISTKSSSLQVDNNEYLKPYLIKNDITIISVDALTIILSTQAAFDAYRLQGDTEDSPLADDDSAVAETEMTAVREVVKKRPPSSKFEPRKKMAALISKLPNPKHAVYAATALSVVVLVGTIGFVVDTVFLQAKAKEQQRLNRLKTENAFQQKKQRKKNRDIHNDFNAIMAYYPNLQLTLDYDPNTEKAIISGYSSDTNQAERFVRSLKDDLGIDVEFKIKSVENLSVDINTKLAQTALGDVSLVYPDKGKLTCITSAYESEQYSNTEKTINSIAKNTGYPEEIKCTKVLFSKREISFVSNTEYPFVKLKNGSVFFKDSEVSQGVFLVDIDDDKLTFKFKNTKFYLTLR